MYISVMREIYSQPRYALWLMDVSPDRYRKYPLFTETPLEVQYKHQSAAQIQKHLDTLLSGHIFRIQNYRARVSSPHLAGKVRTVAAITLGRRGVLGQDGITTDSPTINIPMVQKSISCSGAISPSISPESFAMMVFE
jgi:hypothetical protein